MINSSRSERGWQARRRIAVLVSLAGVLGLVALGSAGSASAASVANCNAKLQPKGKTNAGTKAKLSFVCDGPVRTFGVGSNQPIKSYGAPNAGAASAFFTCEGGGVGYGCGILDRATPGTQTPGTTGWSSTPGKIPAATDTPTTCNGFKKVAGTGTSTDPNRNAIVTQPCTQQIPAGTLVTQSLKLKSSPCAGGERNPFQIYLFIGGEPAVTAFTVKGDTSTVGEFISGPIKVNLKAYKSCQGSSQGKGKGGGGAKKSAIPPTHWPIECGGSVFSRTTPAGPDAKVSFTCTKNIRAFAVYSNKTISQPGEEPEVTGTAGGGVNESALHQCEGDIPGAGYGCGIVDRQTVGSKSTPLPNGQGISAGNIAEQNMSFEFNACQKPGEPKTKVWLVPMGEPLTSDTTVGEFIGAPQPLAVAYGKCKGGKKK